ncbi:thioesterase family protein [Isoptericola halotolerans]|uniref:Acyl-CoA thioester hydrolase n=1 Tax=Isoptericola halotolerans TaxID=300560 RepID=A0ABX2A8W7_9MICO|nr:thioesterase family protein [Isoptericola halotolerans]NOV98297.1 acyl-CoA thioester hydrolase [Isoptericola halotolerans]
MPIVRHPFALRWNDNDQYGHVNNTVYYQAMDTAVNTWMIREAGLDPAGDVRGYCVASSCDFRSPVAYPDDLEVGIGVGRLGTTSLTWDLQILRAGDDTPVAEGRFTHVFVDAATQRPVPVPAPIRAAVEEHLLEKVT